MTDETGEVSNLTRFARAKELQVPQTYANGFAAAISGADCQLVLERNGEPVAMLNISFTLAKTLALALGTMVSNFENATGQQLLTTHDVDSRFNQALAEDDEDRNDTIRH